MTKPIEQRVVDSAASGGDVMSKRRQRPPKNRMCPCCGDPMDATEPTPRDVHRNDWLGHMKSQGLRFFVLKAEDFLRAIDDDDVEMFNVMLRDHEQYRVSLGKHANNKYWVVNRDEPWAHEVAAIIKKHCGKLDGEEDGDARLNEEANNAKLSEETLGSMALAFASLGVSHPHFGSYCDMGYRLIAEVRRLRAENARLRKALETITRGEGRYSRDPLTHADNCIEDMKEVARAALNLPETPDSSGEG